jgi:circadian clock protein KaiC
MAHNVHDTVSNVDVLSDEQKPGKVAKPRASTGVPGLDNVLSGGLPIGHLYLIEGDPGTGKTTIGLQFLMQGARAGERVLYVALSESKRELIEGAESHGWSLEDVGIYEFAPTEQSLRSEDQYSHFHPAEIEFQDTTQHILEKLEALQPTRVVFDSLSELRLLARDSLRFRRQILALKHFFLNRSCTVLLLDDRTADGHDLQLQSIAHGVIMLERLQREYGVERRRLRVSKLRACPFREGFHDYLIETGGVKVYPRLVAGEHRQEEPEGMATSGIAALDQLWFGGIPRGTSTLVIGPAGSGKSSIVTSYAVAAAERKERAAIFNFDETLATIYRRSAQLGADLRAQVKSGMITIAQLDPAEVSPGQFVDQVRAAVEIDGARIIVIDSLNGFLNAMSGEHMLVAQMHELLTFLNQRGVVTLLVLTLSGMLGSSLSMPVDLSYLSDNVLVLRFFEAGGRLRKAISVVKKRSGKHEDTIRELTFSPKGIHIGEALTEFSGVMTGVPTLVEHSSTLKKRVDESESK